MHPAEPETHWPVVVLHTLPSEQSLLPVQGPQVPLTQPRPPQVSALLHDEAGTHWPCAQFSPVRHCTLAVHWPQWPGLPEMHTGALVPWQSRLFTQPITHAPA